MNTTVEIVFVTLALISAALLAAFSPNIVTKASDVLIKYCKSK
jgi:hypothetical protein